MRGHDVVVVGARVAGAATALHLARAGHDVAIFDRAGPPTDTISTHALMRSGVLALQRANALERVIERGTPEIHQVDLVFGSELISFPVADECGVDAYYAPRRTVLDTALMDAAIEAGVTFASGISVTGVVRSENGSVAGVTARTADGDVSIAARQVVGADGTNSRIARAVEAPTLYYSKPTNSVVYSYFQGIASSGYNFRFVDRCNVGVIPTNDGQSLVFVGGPLMEAPVDSDQYLTTSLRRVAPDLAAAVAGATRAERFYRANGIPNLLRDPGGAGWSLVGDAGFTEDPIAAHGITDALRDAELCAEAVSISLWDPSLEVEAKAKYQQVRNRFAYRLLEATVPLARFEWDGAEASRLLRQIGDVAESECELLSNRPSFALA